MAKKELPPYNLRVLTNEYLIEGTVCGDTNLLFPNHGTFLGIHCLSAKIQPVRMSGETTRTYNDYYLNTAAVLTYIPDTDITLLPEYAGLKLYKVPNMGLFHIGPYSIAGKLMTLTPGGISPMTMVVLDVHLTCDFPEAKWMDIYAPVALVNPCEMHGCILG